MDEQNTPKTPSFDLDVDVQPAQSPVEPVTSPQPTTQPPQPPQQEVHEIKLDNLNSEAPPIPENPPAEMPVQAIQEPTTNLYQSSDNKIFKFKKYIIIAAISILALAIGIIIYKVLSTNDSAAIDSQDNSLTNSLSNSENSQNSSEEMQKLDSVVKDLKDVYDTGESKSNPPSLVIDLSEESTADIEANPEQPPQKISR